MNKDSITTNEINSIREMGAKAFHQGLPDTVCPYPIHSGTGRRLEWMSGYYEARTQKNVGHILNKKTK